MKSDGIAVIPVVTIDGPSGAGKGTVASLVADAKGWHLLDSGALYRIIAVAGLAEGIDLADEASLVALSEQLDIVFADGKKEATQRVNPILIDVRTQAEWDDGHIETAIHIPLDKISNTIEGVIEDKDQVIYLYCRSGNRSGQAEVALKSIGYVNAKNIGGIKDASTNLRLKILRD